MQTVGHISGAANFYSRQQLQNDPFPKDKVDFKKIVLSSDQFLL
jgi:hypothetical protein